MSNSSMNFTAHGSITLTEKSNEAQTVDTSFVKDVKKRMWDQLVDLVARFLWLIIIGTILCILNFIGFKAAEWEQLKRYAKNIPVFREPPALPEIPIVNEFRISVGKFSNQEQAHMLAANLRAANINNYIRRQGDSWYVCVGRFGSFERADRKKQEIINRGFEDATVLAPQRK